MLSIVSSPAERAFARRQRSPAMNISRTSSSRSSPKNMCSVRQRPIPSAPNERARSASSAASALARTPSRRISSAHSSTRSNSSLIRGSIRSTSSTVTSPLEPSIAIRSPAWSSVSPTETTPFSESISSTEAPATHGLPIPRATRAACEDLPPSAVRIPRAA